MVQSAAAIRIQLFGRATVIAEPSRDVTPNGKPLALLVYLLLHRDVAATRESIAFALWPDDDEEAARANLRRALHLLQRTLPPDAQWIDVERRTIAWNTRAPYHLDVEEYERLVSEGSSIDAIALYDGDLLPQLDDEWLAPERDRLRELQLRVSREAVTQLRERGEYARAIELAKNALRIDPWHEDVLRELIAARAQSGDRAGALREYRTFEDLLKREIGAEPMPETVAAAASAVSAGPRTHNLPAPISSFVGREAELNDIKRILLDHRLVTLVGTGGGGKTRLALRAAEQLLDRFSEGMWYVDLAPIDDARFLTQVVAAVLGLPKLEGTDLLARIAMEIGDKQTLLLLDNCDRLVGACADLAQRVLTSCPNVTILATSRESLGLSGETIVEVLPLQEADAISLFSQRVASARPQFSLDRERTENVRELCRRLDCIPLALELAAPRLRTLSLVQTLELLADRFALLKTTARMPTAHQQTLRGAIDWSYDLLGPEDRRFLSRFAVFAGSSSLGAIGPVCAPNAQSVAVLDQIATLVDKSFVVAERRRDETRYRLLETIREYLLEKLTESGEMEATRTRHLMYFARFAEGLEPELTGREQMQAMQTISRESDNIRAAFSWTSHDRNIATTRLRLATALRWYYWFRSLFGLARMRLSEALSLVEFTHSITYAKALSCLGFFALQQGDLNEAVGSLERALEAYEGTGAERESVLTSIHLTMARMFRGDSPAGATLEQTLEHARETGDPWLISYALAAAGMQAALDDRPSDSIAFFHESVGICDDMGESFQGTFWLLNLAVQQYHVAPERAIELFIRCADRAVELQHERVVAGSFEGFGWCMQRAGEDEIAAELLGTAEELRRRSGHALLQQWQAAHEEARTGLAQSLDPEVLRAAWERGATRLREASIPDIYASIRPRLIGLSADSPSP